MNLKQIAGLMEGFSGAEIKAACTEAGYFAIRKNKHKVSKDDFVNAVEKVKAAKKAEGEDYMKMFG